MPAAATWQPAYIGLGANLGDPAAQVLEALERLAGLARTRLIARSRLYRSAPVGYLEQPPFVNAVAGLLTELDAPALHQELRALEQALGKSAPVVRFGPRRIDLDLLVYGAQVLESATLTLPHPRLHERGFVLYPLRELAPALWVPGHGRVAALCDALDGAGAEPLNC